MRASHRTILLATAMLAGLAGTAAAAEGKDTGMSAGGRGETGAPTTSEGAGGLSGTGAVKDGARTGSVEDRAPTGGAKAPAAPAAGTTR
ncbi:hypothetical protein ACU4GR_17305 [Methylobacterium oryzae CBMB20]